MRPRPFHERRSPRLPFAGIALVFTLILAAAPARAEDDKAAFEAWAKQDINRTEFVRYLTESQVMGVVPLRELVRTATDWQKCGGPQFEVPPRDHWGEARQVLKLVEELKKQKILVDFEAVSNYRNPKLNACAGGAKRSSHTRTFAIDVWPLDGRIDQKRLCDFWRSYGKIWKMGLSRYPSGRIHIDTSGWRSWGSDHKKRTAFCV